MNLEIILRVFKDSELLSHIVLTGGAARNKTLYHILADIYEIPIHIPNYIEEATSIGATVTAGVGVGIFKDFDIIKQFIRIVDTIVPNSEHSRIFNILKNIFKDSYYRLQSTFQALSRFRTDSWKQEN